MARAAQSRVQIERWERCLTALKVKGLKDK